LTRISTKGEIGKQRALFVNIVIIAAAILAFAILTTGLTATPVYAPGPSACPDPGYCTCNAASGVMTDHKMAPPFNRINNGCTESGTF
jgi:hypothetical protein